MRHRTFHLLMMTAVTLLPVTVTAQGTVTLQVSASATTTMYKNDTLVVSIIADMSAAAGRTLGSVQFDVAYDTTYFKRLSGAGGGLFSTTINTSVAPVGATKIDRVAAFDASGSTTTFTLYTVRFVVADPAQGGVGAGNTSITVSITTLADELGNSIAGAVRNLAVTQVNTGRPVALRVVTQPGAAVGGQVFSGPVLEVLDAASARSTVNVPVTATVASGSGTLSGTTTINSISGVATYTNLKITGSGAHTLGFSSPGLTGTTSSAFTVQPPATILIAFGADTASTTLTGDKLALPLRADMSLAQGKNLASLTGSVAFDTARFHFDSVKAVLGSITPNATVVGSVGFSIFDAVGTTTTQTLATFHFTAHAVGATPMVPVVTVMGDDLGGDLMPFLATRSHNACVVAAAGRWGDATGDGLVNIVDAQQIARYTVSLAVANLAKLLQNGDVTADGAVNIVDAQQIARFTVGLTSAARTNTVIPGTCVP